MNKILFVGDVNLWNPSTGGVVRRNQYTVRKLKKQFNKVCVFDISKFKNNKALMILSLLFFFSKNNRIVFSISNKSLIIISYLSFLLKKKKITTIISGGGELKEYLKSQKLRKILELSCIVYVQAQSLADEIRLITPNINAKYLQNFKPFPNIEYKKNKELKNRVKLLYLSRVHKDKGIFRAIEVCKKLNDLDKTTIYTLDIYGNMELNEEELIVFNDELRNNNLKYYGFIDLNSSEDFRKLIDYHFMLFLTTHPNEGFPGVLVDALIANLPVIATDWLYNKEILVKDNIALGAIIQPNAMLVENAVNSILNYKNNEELYHFILKQILKIRNNYNIENVNIEIC